MNTEWSAFLLWKAIYLRHNQTSYLEPSPRRLRLAASSWAGRELDRPSHLSSPIPFSSFISNLSRLKKQSIIKSWNVNLFPSLLSLWPAILTRGDGSWVGSVPAGGIRTRRIGTTQSELISPRPSMSLLSRIQSDSRLLGFPSGWEMRWAKRVQLGK